MQSKELSQKWQKYLSNQPESGMGYQRIDIEMSDGTFLRTFVFNGQHLSVSKEFNMDKIKDMRLVLARCRTCGIKKQ